MIVRNITQYHSMEIKSRQVKERNTADTVSRDMPVDTYEPSGDTGTSEIRTDLINTVKKRIASGYYNSNDVLDDLSDSFADALNQTI
jgi:hypothetical protein